MAQARKGVIFGHHADTKATRPEGGVEGGVESEVVTVHFNAFLQNRGNVSVVKVLWGLTSMITPWGR